MSTDSKLQTSENNFTQDLNNLPLKRGSVGDVLTEEDVSSIFRELHVSTLTKAASISPDVKSVTLGVKCKSSESEEVIDEAINNTEMPSASFMLQSSTPEKNTLNLSKYSNTRQKIENLSPIEVQKMPSVENSFSCQKLLSEFDAQRRLTVDKVMRERIQNMYDASKLIRESLEHLKQTRQEEAIARRLYLERKILDEIHEQEVLNRPKREAQWAKDNLKEAQRIQERNQRVKEAEEEAKKKSEAILLKRKQVDKILFELQKEYNQEYKQMLETIKLCKDKAALTEFTATQSKMLKDCAVVFEGLLKKCKQGDVNEDDVASAKKLVETLKSIHECFLKEIVRINESVNAEVKKEESMKKTEPEQNLVKKDMNESSTSTLVPASSNSEIVDSELSVKTSSRKNLPSGSDGFPEEPKHSKDKHLSDCFDARTLETYLHLKNLLECYEKTIEPLLSDESLKKFRFSCQKAVNIPVNAISPVSESHLSDKYLKLHNLLSGRTVDVGNIKITASQHPLGVAYCKYLLAKKFVRQGDLTVSSKPDAAFSIATVLASLWIDFPDFGQLVLAHFQLTCPYLAPVFMPQVEGQSDEDYHKSLGYHYSQNGEVEKQDSFLKRMSGIMRLYAALLISRVRQPGKMNPLGLSEGWRWISALLNLQPKPDICATLLYDFLEVAGNEMFRAYGGQFRKMLAYICQEYFPKLEKVTPSTAGGPMVRLEGFLQKILKEESIPPPQGVLPPNFW